MKRACSGLRRQARGLVKKGMESGKYKEAAGEAGCMMFSPVFRPGRFSV
jgi:hypothetical protein